MLRPFRLTMRPISRTVSVWLDMSTFDVPGVPLNVSF